MTRSAKAQAIVDEIDALQIEIAKALVALEAPCEFCGVISACHPKGAAGKPVNASVCYDCVESADTKLIAAHEAGQAAREPNTKS